MDEGKRPPLRFVAEWDDAPVFCGAVSSARDVEDVAWTLRPLRQTFAKYPKPLVRPGRKVPRYMRRPSEGPYGGVPRAVMGSWTAISTPPYFSALAIWPSIGRWTGGGAFASEREILINEAACGITPIQNVPIPRTLRITSGGRTRGSRMPAYQPYRCGIRATCQHCRDPAAERPSLVGLDQPQA